MAGYQPPTDELDLVLTHVQRRARHDTARDWATGAARTGEATVGVDRDEKVVVALAPDEDGTRWPVCRREDVVRRGTWARGTVNIPRCPAVVQRGERVGYRCLNSAGQGTGHFGVGNCVVHRGGMRYEVTRGAWVVAHAFARELNCSPWEGLLRAVRISAGKVVYAEWVLGEAAHDRELEGRVVQNEDGLHVDPDTGEPLGVGQLRDRSWWVAKSELWVDRLARYSKMAIDAGVAERLVRMEEDEARRIARVLNAALDEARDLPEEVQRRLRARMRAELLAVEAEEAADGSLTGPRAALAAASGSPTVVDGEAV